MLAHVSYILSEFLHQHFVPHFFLISCIHIIEWTYFTYLVSHAIGAAIAAAQLQGSVSCGGMSGEENFCLVGK
jgi:hypothetical protein